MEEGITTFLLKAIETHPTVSTLATILIAFEGTAKSEGNIEESDEIKLNGG